MRFDLETAKARLGITNTDSDALILATQDMVVEIAERYCDRKFTFRREIVKFYHFTGDTLFLPRYPVREVFSWSGLPELHKIHHRMGTIELHRDTFIEEAQLDYAGGYQDYPGDLLLALWGMFDVVWPSVRGQASVSSGEIESVTIPDVGTVRFATGNSGGSSGSNSGDRGVYGPFVSVLEFYRRLTC
jgi:hypothetical protein